MILKRIKIILVITIGLYDHMRWSAQLAVLGSPLQAPRQAAVIVIGAGASGMAAATRLMSNGFTNVTILEAEYRYGGRVHTIPFGEGVVDMGAQWCHGQTDNVVYEMARNHNLLDSNTARTDDTQFFQSDGGIFPVNKTEKLRELGRSIMHASKKQDMLKFNGSVGEYFMSHYETALQTSLYADIDPDLATQFVGYLPKFEGWDGAWDNWFNASARGFARYWDCDGDLLQNWQLNGYWTVFKLLMNRMPNATGPVIPADERIKYGHEVDRIVWYPNASSILVECSDGSRWTADHVINTVSLGVLKERTPHGFFEPPLPVAKLEAIEGLVLGSIDKFYLEFAAPFWPPKWVGFSLMWSAADLARLQPDELWIQDVFSFYPVDYQPNILCGWMLGENARNMEGQSHEEVLSGAMWLLNHFLAKTNMTVTEPIGFVRSQWYSNPHFRGSYSYMSTRGDELATSPAALAEPLLWPTGAPVLQFAGEATHDHYFSTVHGAIETGWREADRLIDWYNGQLG